MKAKFVNESLASPIEIKNFLKSSFDDAMSGQWGFTEPEGYSAFTVIDPRSSDPDSVWSYYACDEPLMETTLYKADKEEFEGEFEEKLKPGFPWIVTFWDDEYHNERFTYKAFPNLESAKDFMGAIIGQEPILKPVNQ
jgi:hypothetical protein